MANGIFSSQPMYALDLLARFHMGDCKPSPIPFQYGFQSIVDIDTPLVYATLYYQLVGSLIYLMLIIWVGCH
jgi:hypothetical protein